MLASLEKRPWLVVLGRSVQRVMFLALVDTVLAQGRNYDFRSSAMQTTKDMRTFGLVSSVFHTK